MNPQTTVSQRVTNAALERAIADTRAALGLDVPGHQTGFALVR